MSLQLLDTLDQQLQLGGQCVQFGVFHGLSLWEGMAGLYRLVPVMGQTMLGSGVMHMAASHRRPRMVLARLPVLGYEASILEIAPPGA